MNISYNWLRTLIPTLRDAPGKVAERLAMYGAPVDELVAIGEPLRDIVIAQVVEARRHPDSDHLSLCKVDAGGGALLSVVCGASNVRAERFYPFAPVGAQLPDGTPIRRRKIRGEESQGMLCSARELQLGRDHEGILELNGTFRPGELFVRAVDLDDYRIVVDVTPNRPDLLSHFGVARELAEGGEASIALPPFPGQGPDSALAVKHAGAQGVLSGVRIQIDEPLACPRYMAALIRNVRIGAAPEWLASRLRAVGQRPINNVVDATNYVLQELGQPLHAFDLRKLGGPAIVVRNALPGETLVTLDGVQRTLAPNMLVIADAARATAVAGVMGGRDSEVDENTVDVLIECAHFAPKQIRSTRRTLDLSTDASYRFERGVDPTGMERALRRLVDLVLACAGGAAESTLLDVCPTPFEARTLEVRGARAAQVLGQSFSTKQMADLLEPIGFQRITADATRLRLSVPGHRWFDVLEEIDLVEEVARRFGYNAFPTDLRPFRPSCVPDHPLSILEDELRTQLVGAGLLEARRAGFATEEEGDVALVLPLSSAESRLRRALLPGLVQRIEYNFTRGTRDVRLFEIGTAFGARTGNQPPDESTRLAIAFTGARAPRHWSGTGTDLDLWDLKGLLEDLALPRRLAVRPGSGQPMPGVTELLEPATSFEILCNDAVVGQAGCVRGARVDAPAWAATIFGLELKLDESFRQSIERYRALPVMPATEQDLALVVPDAVTAQQVELLLRSAGGDLLEQVIPFDVFRGAGVPDGTRSIAYRLRFRAPDRTLTDADTRTIVGRILKRLKDDYGIERRG
jgi:phenylalanyl-tRNA synthetase beta chain